LFDLDHTLLPIDSDFEWGEFLAREGRVDGIEYRRRNARFFEEYCAGTLDIGQFLAFQLEPLARWPRAELDLLHSRYMDEVVAANMRQPAVDLVARHRNAGDLCAMVTATNAFVTGPIAQAFGIAHLIATVPVQVNGRFTGEVRGTPCFRDGKLTRVEAWLESMGLHWGSFAKSYFYGDSRNDVAIMERVSDPIATNADPTLRALAAERGWCTLELFDDPPLH